MKCSAETPSPDLDPKDSPREQTEDSHQGHGPSQVLYQVELGTDLQRARLIDPNKPLSSRHVLYQEEVGDAITEGYNRVESHRVAPATVVVTKELHSDPRQRHSRPRRAEVPPSRVEALRTPNHARWEPLGHHAYSYDKPGADDAQEQACDQKL